MPYKILKQGSQRNRNVALLLCFVLLWFSASAEADNTVAIPEGCVIPSGATKGSLDCLPPAAGSLLNSVREKARAKITEVLCDPHSKGSYAGKATVESWLMGSGPKQLAFTFSSPIKAGKGLSADFLLLKRDGVWRLKEVTNRTSSEADLPACP